MKPGVILNRPIVVSRPKSGRRQGLFLIHSLLIVDMQQASLDRVPPLFDASGLVHRINLLARRVRESSGKVIIIQTTGPRGTPYDPDQAGWKVVSGIDIGPDDLFIQKMASDAFQSTKLEVILNEPADSKLIIAGCDTEFCIDSTVRSALARGYDVTVPEDGHSLPDRPHLTAQQIISHHNAIWSLPGALAGPVTVQKCSEILA
jgi:nicotinamidase-related amidase